MVLDAGCGTGENALHVASLGLPVLGVDVAETALAIPREKADERGIAGPTIRLNEPNTASRPRRPTTAGPSRPQRSRATAPEYAVQPIAPSQWPDTRVW